mgnify:CR=1 FL=1
MKNKFTSECPLVLDGAMGTELLRMGVELPLPLWSAVANEICSDKVYNIHREYINAGANVLTTNSFRSTPYAYKKAGFSRRDALLRSEMNLKKSVSLAKKAVSGTQLIAGSIAPIEDCYSPEIYPGGTQLKKTMELVVKWFCETEVDIILFETMGNAREISRILLAMENCDLPIWLSLILEDKNHLLDGTSLPEILEILSTSKVEILLLNCNTIQLSLKAIHTIKRYWHRSRGVYPNLGIKNPDINGKIEKIISNETWRYQVKEILFEKPDVIGACCGSTPEHIRIIKEIIESELFD